MDSEPRWRLAAYTAVGDEHLMALGALTIASTDLERYVEIAIALLLEVPEDREALMTSMQMRQKARALSALLFRRIGHDQRRWEEWREIEKRLDRVLIERRQMIHGTWRTEDFVTAVSHLPKARSKPRVVEFDAAAMWEVVARMEDLTRDVLWFAQRHAPSL